MSNLVPFVSFYKSADISPVGQDVSDLNRHYQRRDSLFRSLGIMSSLVKNASVLEFGPGSGHNALYTASLHPLRYDLVDANPKGVKETSEKLLEYSQVAVHECMFEEYSSDMKYDIVWAEGCLPHQANPLPLLDHIASFVHGGGAICLSTANGVSYLSEILRRLFRDRFFADLGGSVQDQALALTPYYLPHLRYLKGMSRPVNDWILDNIIQPLQDRKLMSIPEVVSCIGNEFDVYGASPRFLTDWRWYKEIVGVDREFNSLALSNYHRRNLNLVDYRFEFPDHSEEFGAKLELLCGRVWDIMCAIESECPGEWVALYDTLDEVQRMIAPITPETSFAIQEITNVFQHGTPDAEMKHFSQWWGRGQQYLSLIKRSPV